MSYRFLSLLLILPGALSSSSFAASWDFGSTVNTFWGEATNWNPDSIPNNIGDTLSLGPNNSSDARFRTITLANSAGTDASFTISSITMSGNSNNSYNINNVSSGTGAITLDVASGNASISMTGAGSPVHKINVPIILNDSVSITSNGSGTREINRPISTGTGTTNLTVNAGNASPAPIALTLTAANTYNGSTTLNGASGTGGTTNGAVLRISGGNDRLPTGTILNISGGSNTSVNASAINGGGRFDLNNQNQTIAGLTGGGSSSPVLQFGTVTNNAAAAGTGTLTVSSTVTNSTFAGIIQDGSVAKTALTKAGSGTTLTLSGTNTYTGATNVNGGTLLISGTLAAGSAVSINNTGKLGGGGSAAGSVTVNTGGAIAPGSSIGTLAAGSLTLQSGAEFQLELNTSAQTTDLLNVGGNLNLAGGSLLQLTDLGSDQTLGIGTAFTFVDYGGLWNGGVFTWNSTVLNDEAIFSFGANSYQISYDGLDDSTSAITLEVVAVPEPSSYTLLGAATGIVLCFRRRRIA